MEKSFMTVDEVAEELKVSKSYAYKVVRELNAEAWLSDGIWESEHEFLSQKTLLWQRRMTVICRECSRKGDDAMVVYKDGDKWRVLYRYTD